MRYWDFPLMRMSRTSDDSLIQKTIYSAKLNVDNSTISLWILNFASLRLSGLGLVLAAVVGCFSYSS